MMRRGLLVVLVLIANLAWASGGGGGGEGVQYVDLTPAFVTNYGGGSAGPQFLKVDISVRVKSPEAAEAVKYHGPALRHSLLQLFAAQNGGAVATPMARDTLRKQALAAVNKVLKQEEGKELVEDLFFTSFILQR